MKPPSYIFASCKPWHKPGFDLLQITGRGHWEWVATPDELDEAVRRLAPRYIFFLHWSWHVPVELWSRYECVCFHMTDVPYGRGGSPLQNLILAGHTQTQLSALRMVEEMDAGPLYTKCPMPLAGRAEDIYVRAGQLSIDIIRWMVETEPMPVSQQGEPVLFKRRKPAQSALPTEGNLLALYDHIRMLDAPTYPLAFIEHGNYRIEFSHAEIQGDEIHATVVMRKKT